MGFYIKKFISEETALLSKNRVMGFFFAIQFCVWFFASQAVEAHLETGITPTKTVSGARYNTMRDYEPEDARYTSEDPIGEVGFGLTQLYNYPGNKKILPNAIYGQTVIPIKSCRENKCASGAVNVSQNGEVNMASRTINSFQTKTHKAYGFAQNNPIIRIDPLGLSDCVCKSGSHKGRHKKPGYTPTANGCSGVRSGPFDFTSACNGHDICYGNCNSDKSACDLNFYNAMMNICSQNCGTDVNCLYWCGLAADTYYAGVYWGGSSFYNAAQNDACEDCCCP